MTELSAKLDCLAMEICTIAWAAVFSARKNLRYNLGRLSLEHILLLGAD
jgi:hypothetical protein